jgi:hypothetical protein
VDIDTSPFQGDHMLDINLVHLPVLDRLDIRMETHPENDPFRNDLFGTRHNFILCAIL